MLRKAFKQFLILACLGGLAQSLGGFDDLFFDDDEFVVTAIFGDCALINEQWYCAGDRVLGSKFILARKDRVLLDDGVRRFYIYLKKSSLNR